MRNKFVLPGLALLLGMAGFFLRRRELVTAFEPTGLPIPGAPMSIALIGLSLIALVVLGLLAWRMCRGVEAQPYGKAFRICCPIALTGVVVAAALLVGGGALGVYSYVNRSAPQLTTVLVGALAIVSGVCVFLSGRNSHQNKGDGNYSGLLLVPAFFSCLWLVMVYQGRAGDPIILDYVYQILAIITLVLALYLVASYSFEKGHPGLTLWVCLLTAYFSCVTLADGHDLMNLCLHAFGVVYGLLYAAILIGNLTAEKEEPPHESE